MVTLFHYCHDIKIKYQQESLIDENVNLKIMQDNSSEC